MLTFVAPKLTRANVCYVVMYTTDPARFLAAFTARSRHLKSEVAVQTTLEIWGSHSGVDEDWSPV